MNLEDFIKLGFHKLDGEQISKIAAQGQPPQPQQPLNNTPGFGTIPQKIKMIQNPDGSIAFGMETAREPSDHPFENIQEEADQPIDPAIILSGKSEKEYTALMLNSFDEQKLKAIEDIEAGSKYPKEHFVREIVQEIKRLLTDNKIDGITPSINYGPANKEGAKNISVVWNISNLLTLCLGKQRLQTLYDYAVKEKQIKRIQGKSTLEEVLEYLGKVNVTVFASFDMDSAKIVADSSIEFESLDISKEGKTLVRSIIDTLASTLDEVVKVPKIKPPPIPLKKFKEAFGVSDDGDDNRDKEEEDDDDRDEGNPVKALFKGLFTMFVGVLEATPGSGKLLKGIKSVFKDKLPRLVGVTPSYRASMGQIFVVLIKNISTSLSYVLKNTGMVITNGLSEHLDVKVGTQPTP